MRQKEPVTAGAGSFSAAQPAKPNDPLSPEILTSKENQADAEFSNDPAVSAATLAASSHVSESTETLVTAGGEIYPTLPDLAAADSNTAQKSLMSRWADEIDDEEDENLNESAEATMPLGISGNLAADTTASRGNKGFMGKPTTSRNVGRPNSRDVSWGNRYNAGNNLTDIWDAKKTGWQKADTSSIRQGIYERSSRSRDHVAAPDRQNFSFSSRTVSSDVTPSQHGSALTRADSSSNRESRNVFIKKLLGSITQEEVPPSYHAIFGNAPIRSASRPAADPEIEYDGLKSDKLASEVAEDLRGVGEDLTNQKEDSASSFSSSSQIDAIKFTKATKIDPFGGAKPQNIFEVADRKRKEKEEEEEEEIMMQPPLSDSEIRKSSPDVSLSDSKHERRRGSSAMTSVSSPQIDGVQDGDLTFHRQHQNTNISASVPASATSAAAAVPMNRGSFSSATGVHSKTPHTTAPAVQPALRAVAAATTALAPPAVYIVPRPRLEGSPQQQGTQAQSQSTLASATEILRYQQRTANNGEVSAAASTDDPYMMVHMSPTGMPVSYEAYPQGQVYSAPPNHLVMDQAGRFVMADIRLSQMGMYPQPVDHTYNNSSAGGVIDESSGFKTSGRKLSYQIGNSAIHHIVTPAMTTSLHDSRVYNSGAPQHYMMVPQSLSAGAPENLYSFGHQPQESFNERQISSSTRYSSPPLSPYCTVTAARQDTADCMQSLHVLSQQQDSSERRIAEVQSSPKPPRPQTPHTRYESTHERPRRLRVENRPISAEQPKHLMTTASPIKNLERTSTYPPPEKYRFDDRGMSRGGRGDVRGGRRSYRHPNQRMMAENRNVFMSTPVPQALALQSVGGNTALASGTSKNWKPQVDQNAVAGNGTIPAPPPDRPHWSSNPSACSFNHSSPKGGRHRKGWHHRTTAERFHSGTLLARQDTTPAKQQQQQQQQNQQQRKGQLLNQIDSSTSETPRVVQQQQQQSSGAPKRVKPTRGGKSHHLPTAATIAPTERSMNGSQNSSKSEQQQQQQQPNEGNVLSSGTTMRSNLPPSTGVRVTNRFQLLDNGSDEE